MPMWSRSQVFKQNDMLTKYQSLCSFLCEADHYTLTSLTFEDLCRRYHVDPDNVNMALYSTMGMSGEEIMAQFSEGCFEYPLIKN